MKLIRTQTHRSIQEGETVQLQDLIVTKPQKRKQTKTQGSY